MKNEFDRGFRNGLIAMVICLSTILVFCKYFEKPEITLLTFVLMVWGLSEIITIVFK